MSGRYDLCRDGVHLQTILRLRTLQVDISLHTSGPCMQTNRRPQNVYSETYSECRASHGRSCEGGMCLTFKLAQTSSLAAQTPIVNTLKTYTNSTPKVPHAPACRRQRHTSSPAPAIATPAVVIPTARPTTRLTGASSGSVLTSGEGLGDGVPGQDGETTPGGLDIDWYIRENPVAVPDESVTKRMIRVPSE